MEDSTIFFFIAWFGLSAVPAIVAAKRGRDGGSWFFLSLLISPLLALIIIVCLPPLTKNLEKVAIANGEMRKCPFCAEAIKSEAIICRYCGKDQPATSAPVKNIQTDQFDVHIRSPYDKSWSVKTKILVAAGGVIILIALIVMSLYTMR